MAVKPRIAVVSPFLDKRHGTERCVVEQIERLASDFEIHVYSARVEDLELSRVNWHRVPKIPAPHLLSYVWFFTVNSLQRWCDRHLRGMKFDLVFSPGINCFDADVIAVHIVFAEFHRLVGKELALRRNPMRIWPLLIHRGLSYRLFMALERLMYTREDLPLAFICRKMGEDLRRFYGRDRRMWLVYHGVDVRSFSAQARSERRFDSRRQLGYADNDFVLLLIGNDWKKKGLISLLEAVARIQGRGLQIAVRGRDDPSPFDPLLRQHGLGSQVRFFEPQPDAMVFYAAADAYVGPSLEDGFGLPPLEAMACGLPVIVSRRAGASEIVTHGVDALILEDPADSRELANLIQHLLDAPLLRERLGQNAARTAGQYTWERNAEQMKEIFERAIAEKEASRRNIHRTST